LERPVQRCEIAFGERPHALDRVEQPGPLLGAEGLAEQRAQESDVVAEGLLAIWAHFIRS
jgi:hypothetical protein